MFYLACPAAVVRNLAAATHTLWTQHTLQLSGPAHKPTAGVVAEDGASIATQLQTQLTQHGHELPWYCAA
jgi:hypothetical protein